MSDCNLYTVLAGHFARRAAAPCMYLPDGRAWTYDDLERASGRMANLLVSLGVRPGDRVAAQVDKSPEALILYLAAIRAGGVFLPLNPAYQRQEIEYFLGDAEPRVFVCRPQAREVARGSAAAAGVGTLLELGADGRGSLIEHAAAQPERFRTVRRAASDLAAILYTSGTTGRSKGAMLTHHNLAANARTLSRAWRFVADDVLLHMLPTFHVHGLFIACHCVLISGAAMHFEPRFDARRALALLPGSSVLMGVPTFYVRLLEESELTRERCAAMRLFISGSAPLLRETFEAFHARTGHTILERYGMTEGGMFTSNPYHGERRGGTVGPALPGMSVRVIDDAGADLPCGTIGHIIVKGDNVFAGYWRMPDKTRQEFTDDAYFRTGDMGSLDGDGYLTISGRSKDLIITGGLNVYPKEIEEVIDAMPGVRESAVIGLPDADFGEAVTAVVVPEGAAKASLGEEVIAAVRQQLAGFKVPKRVHLVGELPRNAMGKVLKSLLRERFGKVTQVAPR